VPGSASDSEKILTVALDNEPTNLVPTDTQYLGFYTAMQSVYEYLWHVKDDGSIEYVLATGYEYSDDLSTLTINIREGVTFSNGDPFTAADVLYTLEHLSRTQNYNQRVAGIDFENSYCEGDYTLVLAVTEYVASFISTLGDNQMFLVLDEKWCTEGNEADIMAENCMGTGAYYLEKWDRGSSMTLVRNENYWGDAPYYDKIIVKFIAESATRMMELQTEAADIVYISTSQGANSVKNGEYGNATLESFGVLGTSLFGFNLRDKSDKFPQELRMAFAHACDWETIIDSVTDGMCTVADSIFPSTTWAYYSYGVYEYDPEYAKECLEAAGYADGYTLDITVQDNGYAYDIAVAMQAYLQEIGITLNISTNNINAVVGDEISGVADAGICIMLAGADPADQIDIYYQGSGFSIGEFRLAEYNDIALRAKYSPDHEERVELYKELQQKVHDTYEVLPLFSDTYNYAVSDKVQGFRDCVSVVCYPYLQYCH
jgi:peptide/nickel transport system substrate-binding protein